MNSLENGVYKILIDSQIWVSVCCTSLCFYLQILVGMRDNNLLDFTFFSTLLAYNLAHYMMRKSENWRLILMGISAIFILILFLKFNFKLQSIIVILGLISLFYSIPIQNKTLRLIPFSKTIWISLVWSVTSVLPLIDNSFNYLIILSIAIAIFLFVFAITLPFDIRDIEVDDTHMNTLPQWIGIKNSQFIGTVFLVLSGLIFILIFKTDLNWTHFLFIITILMAIGSLVYSNKIKNKWFTGFWVESLSALPLIMYGIILLFKNYF